GQPQPESVGDDLSSQRVAVGVQPRARKSEEDVVGFYPVRAKYPVFFHTSDDEARQVVIRWGVQSGHFGRLPADERAAVLAASGGDPRYDGFNDRWIELAEGHVVEEEQRNRALHEDVVYAVVYEIAPNRVVPIRVDGNLDLGAHTIGTGDQNRLPEAGGNAEHPAEAAKGSDDTGGEGGLYELLDPLLCRIGRIDIHAGASVAEGVGVCAWIDAGRAPIAHAGSASSNATRRRMSRMR